MNTKCLDPRGRQGKRTSGTIRRCLSMVGLLGRTAARSADRHDPRRRPGRVTVWDATLGAFRDVDPEDTQDPLRECARQIAALRAALSREGRAPATARTTDATASPAAAFDRLSDEPPRCPFGGGSRATLEGADE